MVSAVKGTFLECDVPTKEFILNLNEHRRCALGIGAVEKISGREHISTTKEGGQLIWAAWARSSQQ